MSEFKQLQILTDIPISEYYKKMVYEYAVNNRYRIEDVVKDIYYWMLTGYNLYDAFDRAVSEDKMIALINQQQ